jgi:Fe-Mn family superoxide dismutase
MYLLPPLPYAHEALQPVIGAETLKTHHGKHHARYVHVVNDLLGDSAGTRPLEEVIATARERGEHKLFDNAAQAWNHAFFWESMAPAATVVKGPLQDAIVERYGNLGTLKDLFVAVGTAHFGSGWVWLMASKGTLDVVATHDAEVPWLGNGGMPLLVCDVWEHAYYLDYKNERDRFLRNWVERLANWGFAAAQHGAALRGSGGYRYPLNGPHVGGERARRESADAALNYAAASPKSARR